MSERPIKTDDQIFAPIIVSDNIHLTKPAAHWLNKMIQAEYTMKKLTRTSFDIF